MPSDRAMAVIDEFFNSRGFTLTLGAPPEPTMDRVLRKNLAAKIDEAFESVREEERDAESSMIYDMEYAKSTLDFNLTAERARSAKLAEAADAYQELATCYRLGKRPSEKLFNRLDKARIVLAEYHKGDA